MGAVRYPDHLLKLIAVLKKFPGVGTKSAERLAFHLIDWPEEKITEIASVINAVKTELKNCVLCGALIEKKCDVCSDPSRNQNILCVVASPKDIFLLEETREYRGLYHVLGALFSPIHGVAPSPHTIKALKERIENLNVKEIIIALDSTLEGDATALYLKKELAALSPSISRLALGLPIGSSLDYTDSGTLARALAGRLAY